MERDYNQSIAFNNKLNPSSSWVSDELAFNASDNDVAPDSPITLQIECDFKKSINHIQ